MEAELLFEVKKRVAWLTINRESRRNAISQTVMTEIMRRLEEVADDPAISAVCFTGIGEKAFCSGADLASTLGGGDIKIGVANYALLLKKMARMEKPLVARVNGPCLAGGMGFMLSCDIVIARDDAYFSTPEVNVGIFPMMIGALIYRHVGRKKAMEMVLTARRIGAAEAAEIGLISRAVPAAKLDEAVEETLRIIAEKSPLGLALGKRAFHHMADLPLEEALDYLAERLTEVIGTEDAAEGIAAFLEKRKPVFRGR
ncbi:MAG: enoyl-CoA hydratase-related protein [Smithellaceae bacterium]|nr:enoyl-CoA hydratase-related protein [Smithellaceae bacterium]